MRQEFLLFSNSHTERHLYLAHKQVFNRHLDTLCNKLINFYTTSPLIKQLIEYFMSQKATKQPQICSLKQPYYWRHLYVVCGGQSPSTVQPLITKRCCNSTQTPGLTFILMQREGKMLQDCFGQLFLWSLRHHKTDYRLLITLAEGGNNKCGPL